MELRLGSFNLKVSEFVLAGLLGAVLAFTGIYADNPDALRLGAGIITAVLTFGATKWILEFISDMTA